MRNPQRLRRQRGFTILEIDRNVNCSRHILLIEIELIQQRRVKFADIEVAVEFKLSKVFPEELSAVEHSAAAHVEQVHGQAAGLEVVPEHISIIVLLGGGNAQ